MKKLLLILCLILVLPSFACSNTADHSNGTDVINDTNDISTEPTEAMLDIPVKDMNGKEFKILTGTWGDYAPFNFVDIYSEEETGDPLNDAAYARKVKIEEQYNCKITQITEPDPWSMPSRIHNSVAAQDNAYDIALVRGISFSALLTGGGYLFELDELPYVDFDKSYWKKNAYDALALGGKHFGVCGDISSNELMAVWTVCFNKTMIKDYGMESPYDIVKSGDWTFDKAVEMAKNVARDINGDSIMNIDDLWGINYTTDTVMGILNSCEVMIANLDSGGIPQVTINSEVNISKIQDIYTKLFDENYSANTFALELYDFDGKLFADERCLFLFTANHLIGALRQMDTDFGIIPYPKYIKGQAEYVPSTAGIFLPIVCVPKSNNDLENTGLFMEAFTYEGSKTVIPAFYENILMGKVARDDESVDMLEYIYGNISYDTGNLFNFGSIATNIVLVKPDAIASFFEENMSALESEIDKLLEEINK